MFYKFKVWSSEFAEGVINMLSDHPRGLYTAFKFKLKSLYKGTNQQLQLLQAFFLFVLPGHELLGPNNDKKIALLK